MAIRRVLLVSVLIFLTLASLVTAGVAASRSLSEDRPDRCANAESPERCQRQARLRAFCAENPDDAKCTDHSAERRAAAYCEDHPREQRCQQRAADRRADQPTSRQR